MSKSRGRASSPRLKAGASARVFLGEITVRRAADGTWRCYECAIERDALAEIAEQEADA